ncbi:MAG: response regulator [Boseongicola sp. SB0675_bin_26]|nr:response regulator [Boseongicola sp. SB0675_bin_26]
MRHRGAHVGTFVLCAKEGGAEFTDEDEDVLVLFAAQAATAVAHARAYRDERRARAGLEALVDTSPVGVAVFDAAGGGVVSLNREAKRIVERLRSPGESAEQLLEVMTCRFSDGREIRLGEFPIARLLRSGETMRAEEIVLTVPDGRTVRTLVNATPIRGENGGVVSVVVTMQDLAALDEIERMRADFLNLVSHELRAPLTSIKGSAATVLGAEEDLDPAELREFFRIIDEQADHMRGLIGDLLDAGRIDSGALSVSPEPCEVAALVDRARNTFLTGGGRHSVLIDLPDSLPRVMADPRRTVQVLNNLLSNAARASVESSPVRVSAVREGVHVAVSVSDEGRGVAPERLAQIFSKHGQPGSEGGLRASGLGLAICKGLVEAQGGRISAASAGIGQGSRFTFTLPIAGESSRDVAAATSSRSRAAGGKAGKARILVVDDDPQTLRYVRNALAEAGHETIVTGDHLRLPGIIAAESPDLVVLDLMLPGTDGIELMQGVAGLADLPVIFISGYGRDETIARALQAGAADYIVKPFSPTELAARVVAALRGRDPHEPFVLGALAIHHDERRVTVGGEDVSLTATEYELLRVLSVNAGRVVTYRALQHQIWSRRGSDEQELARAFIRKLRGKLGDDARNPTYIFNVRGTGYRMPRPDGSPQSS